MGEKEVLSGLDVLIVLLNQAFDESASVVEKLCIAAFIHKNCDEACSGGPDRSSKVLLKGGWLCF
jgi:hypothetical protein